MQSSKKALLAIVMAVPAIAFAQQQPVTVPGAGVTQASPPGAGTVNHAETVETLLVIDSRLAMEKLNEQAAKAAPPAPANAPMAPAVVQPPETIEVVAVLGIGDAKKATILINGKRYSQLVVGSRAGKYVVRQVGGGCVDLAVAGKADKSVAAQPEKGKQAKGRLKHVCFDPDAEYEQQPGAGGALAAQGGGGTINTRMTVAPLPLPVVPAVRVNPM